MWLAGRGFVSRAATTLSNPANIALDQQDAIPELERLHPPREKDLPPLPSDTPPIAVDVDALSKIVRTKLANGSAPGPSGWTGEHIAVLMQDTVCREAVVLITTMIINGDFNQTARNHYLACRLLPLSKSSGGIRPIAMPDAWCKLASIYVNKRLLENRDKLFPQIQMGVGMPGGPERAVHTIRAAMEANPTHVVLNTDITNAFNSCSRHAMASALYRNPATAPAWRFFNSAYNTSSSLIVYDRGRRTACIQSRQGSRQGDPIGGTAFAIAIQPAFEACKSKAAAASTAVAIMDDLALSTCPASVLPAISELKLQLDKLNLSLNLSKCRVLWPHSAGEPQREFVEQCSKIGIKIVSGSMQLLGAMIGDDVQEEKSYCQKLTQEHQPLFDALQHPSFHTQHALHVLRMCMAPRMNYITRVTPPDIVRAATMAFDQQMLETLAKILHLHHDEHLHPTAVKQARMPLRHGGLGLRETTRYLDAAYLSSYAQALPNISTIAAAAQATNPNFNLHITPANRTAQTCHNNLRDAGVRPSDHFPADFKSFSSLYQKEEPDRLQRAISGELDDLIFTDSIDTSKHPNHDVARIQSLAGPRARTWLTTPPRQDEYVLRDDAFRTSLRHTLNINPFNDMPRKCKCGHLFSSTQPSTESHPQDATHLLTCIMKGKTKRHNHVANMLGKLAESAGMLVEVEPTIAQYHPTDSKADAQKTDSCPDIWLTTPHASYLIDVCIMHPCAPSVTSANAKQLHSTLNKTAKKKFDRYDAVARERNATFIPFILDAYGSFHKDAIKLISIISRAAYDNSSGRNKNYQLHMFRCISFALHDANTALMNQQSQAARYVRN